MKEFFQRVEDWYGIDANTSATVLITLIVFGIGLLATWISKRIKDSIDRINYRKSLNHIIYNSAIACQNIGSKFQENSTNAGYVHGNNYVIPVLTSNAITYLSKIDLQVLVNNYLVGCKKELKSEAIANFYSALGTTSFHIVNNKNLENYTESYKKLLEIYNQAVEILRQVNETIAVQAQALHGGSLPKQTFQAEYYLIFDSWFKKGAQFTLEASFTQLVMPVNNLLLKHVSYDQTFFVISNAVNKAKSAYADIENIDALMKEDLLKKQTDFQNAYESFVEILRTINQRRKFWLFPYIGLDKKVFSKAFETVSKLSS